MYFFAKYHISCPLYNYLTFHIQHIFNTLKSIFLKSGFSAPPLYCIHTSPQIYFCFHGIDTFLSSFEIKTDKIFSLENQGKILS